LATAKFDATGLRYPETTLCCAPRPSVAVTELGNWVKNLKRLLVNLVFLCCTVAALPAHAKFNVLLIIADDMGFTDIGSFGADFETPNLDKLASEGLRLTNFHTSVSCSPTRSMVMTGTDNHIAGVGNMRELITPNQVGKPGYEGHLNERVVTLAEVFREDGYNTYMSGKWHLGLEPDQVPHARGFDRSFTLLNGGASHWDDMTGLQVRGQPIGEYYLDDRKMEELPADFYSSRSYADFLIDVIREGRESGQPFFAYFSPTVAHDPIHVPEPWLSKYRGMYDQGYEVLKADRIDRAKQLGVVSNTAPAPGLHPKTRRWDSLSPGDRAIEARIMEAYAGMIDNLDYHIGRIFKFLKDIGQYDNTIIIFTSDNGPNPLTSDQYPGNMGTEWIAAFDNSLENIGHKGSFVGLGLGWAQASAGPLSYFKLTSGEGGVRTPMIISGPGIVHGKINSAFSYVTDIMPTLLEAVGLEYPNSFDGRKIKPLWGRSLFPLVTGRAVTAYGKDEVIGAEMVGNRWLQKGDFKAVLVSDRGFRFGPGEWRLYNTAEDPGETNDLSESMPELLAELTLAWEQYASEVGVVPPE
jgi:arylsulfatase